MTDEEARSALQQLIEERGEDYSGLSRLLGRNPAYVQQYIKRGSPRRLAEEDRRILARYFGVDQALLGGPAAGAPAGLVAVGRYDAAAAAGAGAFSDGVEVRPNLAFDREWLRRLARGGPDQLSIIRVQGDSMTPLLEDGDEILVDRADGAGRLRDGVYVLRIDESLVVKRVALNPAERTVSIRSDNVAYPGWPDCPIGALDVVGRVVWAGGRIG
ncbi:S24 family peptidase [Sphingosinicella terrae]|uniref:S24 family peptidase n=1 Tax=Sphingosinicella terrae TaxID=2172047 RepID=UPI000E0DC961|nr:S24 family peptidase [Sphingosinicella terrae]